MKKIKNVSYTQLLASIDSAVEQLQEFKTQLVADVQQQIDIEQDAIKKYESFFAQYEKVRTAMPSIIRFNVGGTLFATSRETLLAEPNVYFTALLAAKQAPKDDKGNYFIDRDPTYFGIILNFLRDANSFDAKDYSQQQLKKLKAEAEYYCISSMLRTAKSSPTWAWDVTKSYGFAFSNDNRTAKGKGPGDLVATVGFSSGYHEWYVNADYAVASGSQIYVGVCRLSSIKGTGNLSWNKMYGAAAQGNCYSEGNSISNSDSYWAKSPIKVKVELDCEKLEVRVRGHVITLPPNETWYPIVVFGWYDANEQITLCFE